MTPEEIKNLLENDPNYIYSKRFKHSLKNMLDRHPDGVENKQIAQVLLISEEEVEKIYQESIKKIRKIMKVEED